jgi:hypothetical protein
VTSRHPDEVPYSSYFSVIVEIAVVFNLVYRTDYCYHPEREGEVASVVCGWAHRPSGDMKPIMESEMFPSACLRV